MLTYLYIALGSAIGGVARYWCSLNINAYFGNNFPCGTILINVIGSFCIGIFYSLCCSGKITSLDFQKFLMLGLCGGYTTFSSFSLDNLKLLEQSEFFKAGANISISILVCLFSVYAGVTLTNIVLKINLLSNQ